MVFDGDIDIPIIDWRHYLEDELDMHHSHQSFAARQRIIDAHGNADNQVIWFTDARPAVAFDQTPMAFEVIDEWMANIRAHPERRWRENRPAGRRRLVLRHRWAPHGLGRRRLGRRARRRTGRGLHRAVRDPLQSSRRVAGGPFRGGVFKCALQPVDRGRRPAGSTARGSPPTRTWTGWRQIFPPGVCDFTQPDVGRP